MWFSNKQSPPTENEVRPEAGTNKKDVGAVEGIMKPSVQQPYGKSNMRTRISKEEVLAQLESKIGNHDLMQNDFEQRSSRRTITLTRRFQSFLEARRISSRPIAIIRPSETDVLRLKDGYDIDKHGTDEYLAIPILPADEMDCLTSEIKLWHRHRRQLRWIFSFAFFSSVGLLMLSIFFSIYWYAEPPLFVGNFNKTGSMYFNVHMVGQFTNMCLMSSGLMIFRLLPNSKMKTVIFLHAVLLMLAFSVCSTALFYALSYHQTFTGNRVHFYSIHSWVGLLAYSFYLSSILTGFLLIYYPIRFIRKIHSPIAVLAFMFCGAGTVSGFFVRALIQMGSTYRSLSLPGVLVNVAGLLILSQCVFIRLGVANFHYRRRPKPRWDVVVFRSLEAIEDIFLDIHDEYESYEDWVGDVNKSRVKALRVPHAEVKGH